MTLTFDKILQSQGFGSRKECRALVADGRVAVQGQAVPSYDLSCDPHGLVFTVDGKEWLYREHLYLALNKPRDVECSRKPSHHPSVLSLFPEQYRLRDLQPVGRLDHDTTGLLLLSDDGAFIHAQSSPKRHVPKLYRAVTARLADQGLVETLLAGVQLIDEPLPLAALTCTLVNPHCIELVIEQGKYHQVKRMLAAAGNHCEALERIAIGGLRLEGLGLKPGEWMHLEAPELELLKGR